MDRGGTVTELVRGTNGYSRNQFGALLQVANSVAIGTFALQADDKISVQGSTYEQATLTMSLEGGESNISIVRLDPPTVTVTLS